MQQTESRVALEGLAEGTEIALVDPNALPAKAPGAGPTGPVAGAGGPR